MRKFGFAFALLAVYAISGTSVRAELLAPKSDSLESTFLKQKRAIDVYLPKESEKETSQRYETIYVLDGDWNAKIVAQTVDFLTSVGFMPPVIVVGVPNFFDDKGVNSRDHDLTPTVVVHEPRSGGAADFLAFLKNELIPYVESHYPANGVRLIHGHSYGGLFLAYILANDADLFGGYLILDPAMRWDDHAVSKALDGKLAAMSPKGKSIYVAGRSGQAFKGMGVDSLEPIFAHKAPPDLAWSITAYPDETHDSLKFKGTYDALKFAYHGYTADAVELMPMDGLVVAGKPVNLVSTNQRADIHYTLDGSTPTSASPKLADSVSVAEPGKTRFKALSHRGIYDRDIPHHLVTGTALMPSTHAKSADWRFTFFTAEAWPNLSKSRSFEVVAGAKNVDINHPGRDAFAVSAERDIDIPAEGYYLLDIESADKTRVFVSGKMLFEHEGSGGHRHYGFIVALRKGVYPMRVDFLHPAKSSDVGLNVFQVKDGEVEWWKNVLYRVPMETAGK